MFKTKQMKIIFQVFIVLVLSGFSMGKSANLIKGISPYNSAATHFEEAKFVKEIKAGKQDSKTEEEAKLQNAILKKLKEQNFQLSYDKKVKEKIRQVMSRYQLRMDPEHFQKIPKSILAESKRYDYDPMFLTALIVTESSFNNRARSSRGAIGLMQIIPRTGVALATEKNLEWKGSSTLYNPKINIALGAYYLNKLRIRFGDLNLALEAYNHGPTKLAQYLKRGYQPNNYSRKVFKIYEMIDFEPAQSPFPSAYRLFQ